MPAATIATPTATRSASCFIHDFQFWTAGPTRPWRDAPAPANASSVRRHGVAPTRRMSSAPDPWSVWVAAAPACDYRRVGEVFSELPGLDPAARPRRCVLRRGWGADVALEVTRARSCI